ncbi:MAG: SDR family NAD(P)-dependent oxidoreductase [Polaromonas sp.]|nr:SDR family NAD(P)-dependent oxidoreductase [Polaromonas sp.]
MSDIKTSPHFKSAVITGAGGGLGSALAQQLLDSGCKVALLDIAANRAKTEPYAQHTDLAIALTPMCAMPSKSVARVDGATRCARIGNCQCRHCRWL